MHALLLSPRINELVSHCVLKAQVSVHDDRNFLSACIYSKRHVIKRDKCIMVIYGSGSRKSETEDQYRKALTTVLRLPIVHSHQVERVYVVFHVYMSSRSCP